MLKTPDLKTARLLKLADYIERGTGEFDMRNWCHCIAGQVAQLLGYTQPWNTRHVQEAAGEWLELKTYEALQLFCPTDTSPLSIAIGSPSPIREVTRSQAARCLRHYAITGDIDWEKACG